MSAVQSLLPEEQRRARTTHWFEDLPGFGLRHLPSGKSSYIVQTRMNGQLRTVTIGRANLLSEHRARQLARHILLKAKTGSNPADERERVRSAPLFADFLETYWSKIEGRWKASTRTTNAIYRRLYLDKAFADRFIDEIGTEDVQRWFVETTDTAGPGGANRVLGMLGAIFSRAELWGDRPEESNPCRDIRRNRPRRFQRVLSAEELRRLGAELDRDAAAHPVHAAAVRLLLLTGCRVSEVLGLEWRDIRGNRIQLRDAKAGPRTVWLGEEACAVLRGVRRYPGISVVFHNQRYGKPLRTLNHYWLDMKRSAGLPDVRLHDLRHSFASYAARGSETLPMIGKLLGHRKLGSTSRYAHLDDVRLLEIAQDIGDRLEMMLGWAPASRGGQAL